MRTLAKMWERNERLFPNQEAVVTDRRRITFGELVGRAKRLGSALEKFGLARQDRVAMLAMNRAEWMEVYAANDIAGYITATVNFRLAPPEIAYILQDGAPRVLIFEEQYADVVKSLRDKLPSIKHYVCIEGALEWALGYEDVIAEGSIDGPSTRADPQDYSHLIYTSGTTGKPKGAVRVHLAEIRTCNGIAWTMGLRPDTSILLIMPLFHVGSKAQAYAQLWCGGKVIIQRMFDPDLILRTIRDELITHTLLVPTMVQDLLNSPKIDDYDLSSLECLCYAAAPMPVTLLRRTIAKFGKICVDMYGGTEMTLATYLHKHQHVLDGSPEDVKRLGSVGQPTPDVELKIVDDDNRECPPTVAGEILLRSETLMAEYWNNSVATHEAFLDGWYRTGDIGYLDEEGFLFLVDRKKDMIISGGENIYCREVEEALLEYGGLLEAAVIGVPDERWGQTVRAIVVRGRGSDATQEKLVDHCVKIIARYKRPRSIIFVNEMPRLASGKINKVALREAYGSTG